LATLVYSPGVRVVIRTRNEGILDVTDDVVGGNVTRSEDAVSSASIRLANPNRKYDRVFTPNDSISIEMKRVRWMPVFTGYLNSVPYFSAWSREVELTASCTLKRLQHFYWDPYAPASIQLLDGLANNSVIDGGIRDRVAKIMTDVVGWERSKIHIGEVPSNWFENISDLYDAEVERQRTGPQGAYVNAGVADGLSGSVGAGALSNSFVYPGRNAIEGIEGNSATGTLPDAYGRVGTLSSLPPLVSAQAEGWDVTMRWPYRINEGELNSTITSEQVEESKQWWEGRKLVIVSERTNRAIVVVAKADQWGPVPSTGHVAAVSQLALATLGIVENEHVRIGFAAADFPVGEIDDPSQLPPPQLGFLQSSFFPVSGGQGGDSPYPIPSNMSGLSANSFSWGGYENGRIRDIGALPNTAGQPLHFLAAEAMVAMQAAARRDGISLRFIGPRSGYRTFEQQVALRAERGAKAGVPGESRHGWGLAADLAGMPENGGFNTPTYRWLASNAHRFGWINPDWAKQNGRNPEPWHWEFWGIFSYPTSVSRLNRNPFFGSAASDGTVAPSPQQPSEGLNNQPQLFNFGLWRPQATRESSILNGPLALINDTPVMETLKPLINASMRKFSSAPNGDFIAWFPDYFGVYGTAGKMEIKTIELTDFTMNWSDEQLKTHFFVTGAMYGDPNRALSNIGGPVAPIFQRFFALGIASIEQEKIMEALFNIDSTSIFSKPLELLQRFGPRVHHIQAPTIASKEAEFWLAVYNFQRNWASQFSASVPMTFMPELYPGMIIQIPELGFQAYVTRVNHTFDFSQGFKTTVSITAPSSIGNPGLLGLPRAGVRESAGNYEGVDY